MKEKIDSMDTAIDSVVARDHFVTYDTYEVGAPETSPMFLESRVYQGSSGRVYPLPFYSSVATTTVPKEYKALTISNRYLEMMILPEIGGRIHIGFDRISNYDFFYRQDVIKPALVGLAGPWISGGVEFNWPQHHRPSTFMPCEWCLEESADGASTFWLSEHEPMNRMKGMHGVCLRPNSSLIELKVRLYNRTAFTQTFLWWANVAARVHEFYQSFFPKDVTAVADHAKRAVSTFPGCDSSYYGVQYGERIERGISENEMPPTFNPLANVDPNRLDWYANIPVPTSYMVTSTEFEFFGGYDHQAEAGFVHVADRTISPGKKQWTWGNHKFGYAWDRNLTDSGGPYVELMAGVYTDNQPDFSFIAPQETKVFSQYWYPIRKIGPCSNATKHAALAINGKTVGICPSSPLNSAKLTVTMATEVVEKTVDISLELPLHEVFSSDVLAARLLDEQGKELVAYDTRASKPQSPPVEAQEPELPEDVQYVSDLHAIAVHLDQYRHATRKPDDYWREALRRDPNHVDSWLGLGKRNLQQGLWTEGRQHFKEAIRLLTRLNPNPSSGEAHYMLGVLEDICGNDHEAFEAYGKATWNYAFKGTSSLGMARIKMRSRDYEGALLLLEQAQIVLCDANDVYNMKAHCYRKTDRQELARKEVDRVLSYDPLDHWALYEKTQLEVSGDLELTRRYSQAFSENIQSVYDLFLDLKSVGAEEEALRLLEEATSQEPMTLVLLGRPTESPARIQSLFPNRLEEIIALEKHHNSHPEDAFARYLLGNIYYDRRRYEEAMDEWHSAVELDPSLSIAWRNLGIAYFNVRNDESKATHCYERATELAPDEGRFFYEIDQLRKRLNEPVSDRLKQYDQRKELVSTRDDLTLEYANLLNLTGQSRQARQVLSNRVFTPWEGGEGVALGTWSRANEILASQCDDPREGISLLQSALEPPINLGEDRHVLANASNIWLQIGDLHNKLGEAEIATSYYERAAHFRGDFQGMSVRSYSELTFYQALALERLGRFAEAKGMYTELLNYGSELRQTKAKIDYFATSLPTMLLFNDDLQARQNKTADLLCAQALVGLGRHAEASEYLDKVNSFDPNCAFALDLAGMLRVQVGATQ